MKNRHILGLIILVLSLPIHAIEYSKSNVIVHNINALSGNRPLYTWSQNYIEVYTDAVSWGTSSNCGSSYFWISKSDTWLFSTLLTAVSTGNTLTVVVDGSVYVNTPDNCVATSIQLIK